ncbi:MAG: hypothetical protein J6Y03_00985 [Alphaproteobacteria bacterium]|nr:hypothetical protein [Alphaproteobacteria bacterium]
MMQMVSYLYELVGRAFLDMNKSLEDLKKENQTSSDKANDDNSNGKKVLKSQMSELEKVAKEICNLKYIGACCYNADGKLPDFYELVGKAFLAMDKSLKDLKKENQTSLTKISHNDSVEKKVLEAQQQGNERQ